MKAKILLFFSSSFISGLLIAQMSFTSGIDEIIQMQSQSFGNSDNQTQADGIGTSQANNLSSTLIPRITSGDTLILRFFLIENFINSGDFNRAYENRLNTWNPENDLPIYSSYGPLDGLFSDGIVFDESNNISSDSVNEIVITEGQNPFSNENIPSVAFTQYDSDYILDLITELNDNPYVLDSNGVLYLPGINPIPLQGLSVDEAALRIRTEQGLEGLIVNVTLLPIAGSTSENLKTYGQDFFIRNDQADFALRSIPGNYKVGNGDEILVQLYGATNYSNVYIVSNEGEINLPEIGPIFVSGIESAELTNYLQNIISASVVATSVSSSIVSTRPMEIFIAGEVTNPGSHIVSPLSTVIDAISSAGGIKQNASIREIRLIRGQNIYDIDLYNFFIFGNVDSNTHLLPGDTILINPARNLVGISGEVRRQYYFELKEEETFLDLISFAGGFTNNANEDEIFVEKYGTRHPFASINLEELDYLRDGDIVRVTSLGESLQNSVRIVGPHRNEGILPWKAGDRLADILGHRDYIEEGTDLDYVLIKRQALQNGEVEFFSSNLNLVYEEINSSQNIELYERDTIYLFSASMDRQKIINSLILESYYSQNLSTISDYSIFENYVTIEGAINFSGRYPFITQMTISNLIEASGGLLEGADLSQIRVLRRGTNQVNYEENHLIVNYFSDPSFSMSQGDIVTIPKLPQWSQPRLVTISGEVNRPGIYAVEAGESVYEAIERAGGITDRASIDGIIFQRESLRDRERQAKEFLISQVQSQLTAISFSVENGAAVIASVQELLSQYANTQPIGRLSFSHDRDILEQLSSTSIIDGDSIFIPEAFESVSIFGEVRVPSSHIFNQGTSITDYINAAGGLALSADPSGIVVIKASGQVIPSRSRGIFSRSIPLDPGDVILVPPDLNINLQRNLTLVTDITQIIYQIAVAVAAVNSLGTN